VNGPPVAEPAPGFSPARPANYEATDMTISYNCEHCGKNIQASDAEGGKRGKCPFCQGSNYVPAPIEDEELFDLAPEDDDLSSKAEQAEVRRLGGELMSELGPSDDVNPPLEQRTDIKIEDLYPFVVNYCLDMSNSKLDRLRAHVVELRRHRGMAKSAVDDFLNGRAKEAGLNQIPPKVLQAFLLQLKKELA
jgi:DNA-directed RNA polymerase subunit RPC12/RpoP